MSADIAELRQQTLFEDEIVSETYINVKGLAKLYKQYPVDATHRNAGRGGTWTGTVVGVRFEERDGKLVRIEDVQALAVEVDE